MRSPQRRPLYFRPALWAMVGGSSSAASPDPRYTRADFGNTPPPPPSQAPWRDVMGCDVLLPEVPVALLVFIGGLGAGMSAPTFYGNMLRRVSDVGNVAIVAYRLPGVPGTDHASLARMAGAALGAARAALPTSVRALPVIGMGHSLGAKLLLLLAAGEPAMRSTLPINAGIFLSFNNSRLRQALPLWAQGERGAGVRAGLTALSDVVAALDIAAAGTSVRAAKDAVDNALRIAQTTLSTQQDFTPDPEATLAIAGARYPIQHNLIVRFNDDSLDDGTQLATVFQSRFASAGVIMDRPLPGTHLTPVAPDFSSSSFASIGNSQLDDVIRRAGLGVTKEVDATVTVIVAFIRLHLELYNSKS